MEEKIVHSGGDKTPMIARPVSLPQAFGAPAVSVSAAVTNIENPSNHRSLSAPAAAIPRPRGVSAADAPNLQIPGARLPAVPSLPPEKAQDAEVQACTYKRGELPSCAPLAAGFVPYQQKNPPKYSNGDALTHGTLFPGLDLPFMNTANKSNPYAGSPLGELMALDFAIHELSLYLDTHKDDTEAFEMMKTLIVLEREGKKEYTKRYGPVSVKDVENSSVYTWTKDPWPWEYGERTGK